MIYFIYDHAWIQIAIMYHFCSYNSWPFYTTTYATKSTSIVIANEKAPLYYDNKRMKHMEKELFLQKHGKNLPDVITASVIFTTSDE